MSTDDIDIEHDKRDALEAVEQAAASVKDTAAAAKAAIVARTRAVAAATDLGLTGAAIVDACPSISGKMMVSKDLARAATLEDS